MRKATAARLVADGLPAEVCADLAAGLALADIVTCATTAREPIVRGALVRPGTHVDLVGAFTPEMRESDDELVQRAEVFVDTFAGALKEAGDLVQPIAAGAIAREHVRAELADLVTGRHPGRASSGGGDGLQVGGDRAGGLCARRGSCTTASRLTAADRGDDDHLVRRADRCVDAASPARGSRRS